MRPVTVTVTIMMTVTQCHGLSRLPRSHWPGHSNLNVTYRAAASSVIETLTLAGRGLDTFLVTVPAARARADRAAAAAKEPSLRLSEGNIDPTASRGSAQRLPVSDSKSEAAPPGPGFRVLDPKDLNLNLNLNARRARRRADHRISLGRSGFQVPCLAGSERPPGRRLSGTVT